MHGGNATKRQQVVHDGEHAFFHLAAVPRTTDDLDALGEVKRDKILRVKAVLLPIGVGAPGPVHDDKVRLEPGELLLTWANKHVFHEVGLPGHFSDKTNTQPGFRVGAAKAINNIQAFAG